MHFFKKPTEKTRKMERRIADLESVIEAANRRYAVALVEIESMASVVARDRARIEAEGAAYARARAESEGADGRNSEGT